MIYIDSNIFVYAVLDQEQKGISARKLLQQVQDGKQKAATCALTLNETMWVIRKQRSVEDSILASEALLTLNLTFLPVNKDTLLETVHLTKTSNLKPNDATHLASMKLAGITTLISEDKDFDTIKDIKRIDLSKLEL